MLDGRWAQREPRSLNESVVRVLGERIAGWKVEQVLEKRGRQLARVNSTVHSFRYSLLYRNLTIMEGVTPWKSAGLTSTWLHLARSSPIDSTVSTGISCWGQSQSEKELAT